ncbi:MAG: iron chelate uptake ABC transporter family permease subunit [Erysipelothrix sp.]|nr:iron chelate uptake ABC transporter family permease subunit [Erysipelothrix sp.]
MIQESRMVHDFQTKQQERKYWIIFGVVVILGLLAAFGLLVYNNPVPVTSSSFIPVVRRRMNAIIAMAIAAVTQSVATVAFQSVTNNKIITPSLLGFEALYTTIQTSVLYFFGIGALVAFSGTQAFLIQVVAMVVLSLLLYGTLLTGKFGNLQFMLLIGIIIGTGLRSLSSFMRRLLSPSEFDILQARLYGSVNNADPEYFPIVIPIVILVIVLFMISSNKLNVLSLGKDVSTNLGMNYQKGLIQTLVLVSILMSISTALVGPMTFFGFLVATLTYQLTPTYNHKYLFPMAIALSFLVLSGAYFLMYHVFNAQGVVSVIIELIGGGTFLILIFRKGKL